MIRYNIEDKIKSWNVELSAILQKDSRRKKRMLSETEKRKNAGCAYSEGINM